MNKHIQILKNIQSLLAPEPVFVVGGAVRDRILGRITFDYDLVTRPDPVRFAKKISSKLNGTAFVLDQERGVHRVTLPEGFQIDFAQMKGPSMEKDLRERDFTPNAMAVPLIAWIKPSWKKHLLDPLGGLRDIKKKHLAAVSSKIVHEDPLRLLRAFRIAAELQFAIPKKTLQQLKKYRKQLTKSAPERIREEMLKTFVTPFATKALLQMEQTGVLSVILPEVDPLRKTAPQYYGKGGVLKHTLDGIANLEGIMATKKLWFPRCHRKIGLYLDEKISGFPRSAHLKWATLLHDLGKPRTAKKIKGRLRFFEHDYVGAQMVMDMASRFRWSSDETRRHASIVRHHMRPGNLANQEKLSDKAIHRFFRDLGDEAIGLLLVGLGDHLTYLTPRQKKKRNSLHELLTIKLVNRYYRDRKKILPKRVLNGNDIMKAFKLKPSKFIGELLVAVTDAQSEGKVKTKEDALTYLKEKIDGMQKNHQ